MGTHADPLPFGLAIFSLGIGVALVTFLSLSQFDVTYTRTQWTALLSLLLASPAIVVYTLDPAPPGPWWRAFWTVGLLAYLLHFWWAVFGSFHGSFQAVIARQGLVAFSNFAVTGLWLADVVAAWALAAHQTRWPLRMLRIVTWLLVVTSFVGATAIFRTGPVRYLGWLLVAVIVAALVLRWFRTSRPRDLAA